MHITPELEAELNATPVETAVDEVPDWKIRDQLIKILDNAADNHGIDFCLYDCDTSPLADELLKQFIITPRS